MPLRILPDTEINSWKSRNFFKSTIGLASLIFLSKKPKRVCFKLHSFSSIAFEIVLHYYFNLFSSDEKLRIYMIKKSASLLFQILQKYLFISQKYNYVLRQDNKNRRSFKIPKFRRFLYRFYNFYRFLSSKPYKNVISR